MKVRELIAALQIYDGDFEVTISLSDKSEIEQEDTRIQIHCTPEERRVSIFRNVYHAD